MELDTKPNHLHVQIETIWTSVNDMQTCKFLSKLDSIALYNYNCYILIQFLRSFVLELW